ncbi:MAG TPA: response regulator [Chloroflexota bacterium]|jgi:CheY-like chemotaxis protein|nr:response regulator [Chloroflexota bacterium]
MPADKYVLVAEDNDLNFRLVQFILTRLGVEVRRATSGDQALAGAIADPPGLIYMDIQLPGMDGLQVTRQLRSQPATQDVPIVALTALAMVGDEERAIAAGCNAYLTKPVSPHDLQDMTRRYLLDAAA